MAKSPPQPRAESRSSHAPRSVCFPLGRLLATPRALDLLDSRGIDAVELLDRHQRGDWGELSAEDVAANEFAIANGLRILSAYRIGEKERVWIITEADRSSTTVLLPEDY